MPAGKQSANSSNPAARTTFRPPWVKESGTSPAPAATPQWTLNKNQSRRDSNTSSDNSDSSGPSTPVNPLGKLFIC